LQGLVSYID